MAEPDPTPSLQAAGPAVILVEPQLGENIGMVARAMANFGLADLRIVNPRDGWPSEKARAAASRADHVIDAARVFATPEEAISDLRYVVATTARPRDSTKSVIGPELANQRMRDRLAGGQGVGILFGRERFGLSNHEVDLADEIVTFPVNPAFASLNIAQAVLLMAYEWIRVSGTGGTRPRVEAEEAPPARKEDLLRLFEHLETELDASGYFFPAAKREVLVHNLRNLLTRAALHEPEVHALRGVIRSLTRDRSRP